MIVITCLIVVVVTSHLLLKYFIIPELRKVFYTEEVSTSLIGQDNPDSANKNKTVVVIGGSIGGLFSATTLSKHFGKVIIVERNSLPDEHSNESIAPQGYQTHVIMWKGQQIIEKLYPGAYKQLLDIGGVHVDYANFELFSLGGSRAAVKHNELDITSISITRGALETFVRKQVLQLKNVEVKENCTVTGILFDEQQANRIIGVSVKSEGSESQLFADLVVDCSGSGTKCLQWLLQKTNPDAKVASYQTIVRSNVAFSGVMAKLKEGKEISERNGNPTYIRYNLLTYPSKRAVLSYRVEGGRIGLYCQALNKVPVPETIEQAKHFADEESEDMKETVRRYFDAVDWNDAIKIKTFKKEGSVLNHFEKIKVQGFIAMGDAVASLNPSYGQGMTIVAEECLILDRLLRETQCSIQSDKEFCGEFQEALAYSLIFPWNMVTSGDLRYRETKGGDFVSRNVIIPVTSKIFDRFMRLGHSDKYMFAQFLYMVMMIEGYKFTLMKPKVIMKLLGLL